MCFLPQKLSSISPFQLASFEFLDKRLNTVEEFIKEDIPAKFLSADTKPIGDLYIDLNFHKRKWLLGGSYNPNKNNIMNHMDALRGNLYLYSAEYEHVMLLGDFHVETKERTIERTMRTIVSGTLWA